MKQIIKFKSKTASINSLYYNDKRHGKTAEAKKWSTEILVTIGQHINEFKELRELFNPKKHCYSFKMKMLIPETAMYTKDGKMTSLVHDLSNVEKPLIDLIFLPKYFSEYSIFGEKAANLNVDDRYLQYLSSEKVPTVNEWGIIVELEILDKPSAA
jgi:hypothetical protein